MSDPTEKTIPLNVRLKPAEPSAQHACRELFQCWRGAGHRLSGLWLHCVVISSVDSIRSIWSDTRHFFGLYIRGEGASAGYITTPHIRLRDKSDDESATGQDLLITNDAGAVTFVPDTGDTITLSTTGIPLTVQTSGAQKIRLGGVSTYVEISADGSVAVPGDWNAGYHKLAAGYLWNDAGTLRWKASAPTSAGDGADLAATAAYTDEQAQDAVGGILIDSTTIDFTYDDPAVPPTITAAVKANSISNSLLAQMAQSTIKGRAAGAGTGDATEDILPDER